MRLLPGGQEQSLPRFARAKDENGRVDLSREFEPTGRRFDPRRGSRWAFHGKQVSKKLARFLAGQEALSHTLLCVVLF
jgi:hypothetical protein